VQIIRRGIANSRGQVVQTALFLPKAQNPTKNSKKGIKEKWLEKSNQGLEPMTC
jgi:hypothetical protein